MSVKETIAFLGGAGEACGQLARKLAAGNYPLVLVTKEGNHFDDLSGQILDDIPEADIEVLGCEREGCWEADIIILCNATAVDTGLTEKIKEVANRKILVYFSTEEARAISVENIRQLKRSLPNIKWVQAVFYPTNNEIQMTGEEDAVTLIENIFNRLGYRTGLLKTVA